MEVERGELVKKRVRNFEEEEEQQQQQQERREMLVDTFRVDSPFVTYTEETIESKYEYKTTDMVHEVTKEGKYEWIARPKSVTYQFSTKRTLPKLGYGSSSSVTGEFFFPVGIGFGQNARGKCVRKMLRGLLACLQFSSLVSICNWTDVEVCRKPVWFIKLFSASASWTSCVSDAVFTTSTTLCSSVV